MFVVEDEAGVAGFVAGTEDTAAWEDRLEQIGGRRSASSTPILLACHGLAGSNQRRRS